MSYTEDEIKELLATFLKDLKNVSLDKAISNNLEVFEKIKELNNIKWVKVIEILDLNCNVKSFTQSIYRARKKRDNICHLNDKPQVTKSKTEVIKSPKNKTDQQQVKPSQSVSNDLHYPSTLWAKKTLLNDNKNNREYTFKIAEETGLTPMDFENLMSYQVADIINIIQGWKSECENKFSRQSKEDFLANYKKR